MNIQYWYISLLCLVVLGCKPQTRSWDSIATDPVQWNYILAEGFSLREPTDRMEIRDTQLLLIDAATVQLTALTEAAKANSPESSFRRTGSSVLIAYPKITGSHLIAAKNGQAKLPANRGHTLSVILDQRFPIHFLSWTNGQWISTNVLRTSKMAFKSTKSN